jgi:hypothetical protein
VSTDQASGDDHEGVSGLVARLDELVPGRADRRVVFFGLVVGVLVLEFAWFRTLGLVNCSLRQIGGDYCLLFGFVSPVTYTLLAVPTAVLGAALALLLPDAWTDWFGASRVGGYVLGPPTRTLVALVPVLLYACVAGLLLFYGHLTSRLSVWLLLAVPFVPFLLGLGFVFGVVQPLLTPPPSGVAMVLAVLGVVLFALLVSVVQVLWFYGLAAAFGRLGDAITARLGGT